MVIKNGIKPGFLHMKTVDIEHGGSDIYRRSPHEVIQPRDSKRVGASGCMEHNPMKERKKYEICLYKRSVFAFIFR